MFGELNRRLFPDNCVVLEIVPHNYVYPIYKNGSSSLFNSKKRILPVTELQNINQIDVYVRNPWERFLSGVNTYITTNPQFDKSTALKFIEKYVYLDRHFAPQIYWLINLQRFTNAKMHLKSIDQISMITNFVYNVGSYDEEITHYFKNNEKISFFNGIDEVLTNTLINKVVSLNDIMIELQTNYKEVYTETFGLAKDINKLI